LEIITHDPGHGISNGVCHGSTVIDEFSKEIPEI